mmetsp:Transcript_30425/g.35085  ORF Transcript_30425/g.35085 Transcript_30425/m.35085 type:complete len:829 (-) Transcript_30425:200-2686(-)
MSMFVVKRNGKKETVHFDKITARLNKLCYGLDSKHVDAITISQQVIQGVYPGVTTSELDNLAAETAASFSTQHPDFSILAARISVSNLHKQTTKSFSENIQNFRDYLHPKTGEPAPLVSEETYNIVMAHRDAIDGAIIHDRDFEYDYFGFKTLEKSYLLKMNGIPAERPQQLLMRVSIGIHGDDLECILETYEMLSQKFFTHATPTLFNAGTCMPQMSSCFLTVIKDDSIDGIYDTLKDCAVISKYAGGIGLSCSNIRASASYIRGTNGHSNGIIPMLRVFNNTARYVDQGGGKRKGSIAVYIEPWHADIFAFLDLRKNHGNESDRARDLFYALWIPDLFMRRVQANGEWSLMCPNECPGLADCHGTEFDELYTRYEKEGKARKSVRAQTLWFAVLDAQVETGTPYMLFKDHCNNKSNQKNLGTIKCSNLCTEIVEYTSPDEVAVCNLASISLRKMVTTPAVEYFQDGDKEVEELHGKFDLELLFEISKIVTKNLNRVIDRTYYPVKEAKVSNMRHRPIGIGVQGLADAFQLLKIPFDSPRARQLNKDIFETIYFGAATASVELAKIDGAYESFKGSPASDGILQFDFWNVKPSDRWDWDNLKSEIKTHGMRNSLLLAPMPTASTAQILGNNEGTEPHTSNMYNRRVLAGEFAVVNKHLLRELISSGLWSETVRERIIADRGSVQGCKDLLPECVRAVYKTVWEYQQKAILDMAADRGAFICQSQSLNVHMAEPSTKKLTSMHFYAWKKGLKTGMYYLRTRPKAEAIQFTVSKEARQGLLNNGGEEKKIDENLPAAKKMPLPQDQLSQTKPKIGLETQEEEECVGCGA